MQQSKIVQYFILNIHSIPRKSRKFLSYMEDPPHYQLLLCISNYFYSQLIYWKIMEIKGDWNWNIHFYQHCKITRFTSNMSKLHRSLGQRFPFFISASKCPWVIMDLIFEKIFSIRLAPGSQNIGKLRGGFLVDKIFNCRKRELRSFNDEQWTNNISTWWYMCIGRWSPTVLC